jgi:hypothetical protein
MIAARKRWHGELKTRLPERPMQASTTSTAVIATNVVRPLIILSLLVCGVSLTCGLLADKSPAKLQREHGQSLCHGVQPPV